MPDNMEIVISSETYRDIVNLIESNVICGKALENEIVSIYGLPRRTVLSIISNIIVRRMKHSHFRVQKLANSLWKRYQVDVASGKEKGVIINLAHEIGSSPSLLAKILLEQHLNPTDCHDTIKETEDSTAQPSCVKTGAETKSAISKMMRDTSLIEDGRLALEIFLCNLYDEQYGPISEMYNKAVGEEFEDALYEKARENSMCFESEEELRLRGYDKTPDMKLNVPIAVDGFVINWIESKGLFGDQKCHRGYTADQYSSYWNRFGSGLVIYWLGYEESIIDPQEKRFIVRAGFPTNITYLKPLSITPKPPS